MTEFMGHFFIVVGVLFNIFGCIGLVRLPDLYNRLQAATKCVTLGTCSVLLGLFIMNPVSTLGLKAILTILFVLITSPVAAHAIARGAYILGVPLWEKSVVDKYAEETGRELHPEKQ